MLGISFTVRTAYSILRLFNVLPHVQLTSSVWVLLPSVARFESKACIGFKAVSMWENLIAISSPAASAAAVRTMFLICLPFRSTLEIRSSNSGLSHAMLDPGDALRRNVSHKLLREAGERAGYMTARWIRDLNASSKEPIRFVVRNIIPW